MDARHCKIAISTFVLSVVMLFVIWPPKQGYSQSEGINIEGDKESLSEAVQKADSLNHVLKVEIDLMEYQKNQADTMSNQLKTDIQ